MAEESCSKSPSVYEANLSDNERPEKRVFNRKFRSVKRKKRKGFAGSRKRRCIQSNEMDLYNLGQVDEDELPASSSQATMDKSKESEEHSASFRKLLNSSFDSDNLGPITRSISGLKETKGAGSSNIGSADDGYSLMDKKLLLNAINKSAICRACRNPKAQLSLLLSNKFGLAEKYFLTCSHCHTSTPLETSEKLSGSKRADNKGGQTTYEVNCRSVVASLETGRAGLERFCGILNLPNPVSKSAYNKQLKNLEEVAVQVCENIMNEAAARLIEITEKEEQTMIDFDNDGQKLAKVAVTIDGTWQKRGYSSKNGIVFAISVRTGEVLDFEVLSLVCHQCQASEKLDHNSDQYIHWRENHQPVCPINHSGSSGEMETKGAIRIFLRSINKRKLKYTTMVGDGDTGCFGSVREALRKEYGDTYELEKEECVGHIQKRLGTNLRDLKTKYRGKKLADGKGIGGAGRLTDKIIDKMQNHYGSAIRNNKGKLESMHDSIQSILKHMVEEEGKFLEEQHALCPKHGHTWCKFWKDKQAGTETYSQKNRLPPVFFPLLKPVYDRLSDDVLLRRCLKGITQNQNESLHGVVWTRCPKTRFSGKRKVTIAACLSVGNFNIGSSSVADVLKALQIKCGQKTLTYLKTVDRRRLKDAARKISHKYKDQRRKLRAIKKGRLDVARKGYLSGAFGLSVEPENICKVVDASLKKKRRNREGKKKCPGKSPDLSRNEHEYVNQFEPPITFMMPLETIHDFF